MSWERTPLKGRGAYEDHSGSLQSGSLVPPMPLLPTILSKGSLKRWKKAHGNHHIILSPVVESHYYQFQRPIEIIFTIEIR